MSFQLPLDISQETLATYDNYHGDAKCTLGKLLAGGEPLIAVAGEPGSGCSHLLQAASRDLSQNHSGILLTATASHTPEIFAGLESLDYVFLDDAEKYLVDPEWQNALFHLVNSVRDQHHSLVLGCHSAPGDLVISLPDLGSRLRSASLVRTDRLDDAGKALVLKERAEGLGIRLSSEVSDFLLSRGSRQLSDLLVMLDELDHASLAQQRRLTIPLVKEILGL